MVVVLLDDLSSGTLEIDTSSAQVLTMDPTQRLLIIMATDLLFSATSLGFLLIGEAFGRERLSGGAVELYPGKTA